MRIRGEDKVRKNRKRTNLHAPTDNPLSRWTLTGKYNFNHKEKKFTPRHCSLVVDGDLSRRDRACTRATATLEIRYLFSCNIIDSQRRVYRLPNHQKSAVKAPKVISPNTCSRADCVAVAYT